MSTNNVEALSQLASTSLASYAMMNADQLAQSLASASTGANFTALQASAFAERFSLLSQQPNVDYNGFSAAVFQDKLSGEKVLAIRGTEFESGFGQIVTDFVVADLLGIGAAGFANLQGIELYRYWKRLTTAGGQAVQYSDDDIVKLYMMANAPGIESGSIELPTGSVATVASGCAASRPLARLLPPCGRRLARKSTSPATAWVAAWPLPSPACWTARRTSFTLRPSTAQALRCRTSTTGSSTPLGEQQGDDVRVDGGKDVSNGPTQVDGTKAGIGAGRRALRPAGHETEACHA